MGTDSQPVIDVRELVKQYRGRRVVDQVSLRVEPGEIVGLLGPNGAGKTTTFYMIAGLIHPDGGSVLLSGENINGVPVYKRARMGMGYLSQDPSVFRKLSVEQNLMAILETIDMKAGERRDRTRALLEDLGIAQLAGQKAYTLSGGERRKLEISRALVTDPAVMLLDEPFSGVDPIAVNDIQTIIRGLRDRGLGVLVTDHNVRETLSVVDRAYLLFEGRVLREGRSEFLIQDKVSRELYLGEKFKM